VLTTGTFLRGRAITGEAIIPAGRMGEHPSMALSADLSGLGFPLVRLKTGTPPRIDARTVDFSELEVQSGWPTPLYFSFNYGGERPPVAYHGAPNPVYPSPSLGGWRDQLPCYHVYTTPEFHQLIRDNLHRAPMFSGIIEGIGPRYCPSIEDKIVRFADKESHGFFLEPEGWKTLEIYVQGCNTSLPEDVQWAMLRSIPALRNVELMRVGYAIEYDAEKALNWGMANAVFPTEFFAADVQTYAARIARQAPLALTRGKRAMLAAQTEGDYAAALAREATNQREIFGSEDGFEGFQAFVEKRPPVWKGR